MARNIGFEDYFQSDLFRSVDTFVAHRGRNDSRSSKIHISGYSCPKIMILAPKGIQRNIVFIAPKISGARGILL